MKPDINNLIDECQRRYGNTRDVWTLTGQIGALSRHKSLTPQQRTHIARKAANARWGRTNTNNNKDSIYYG